MPDLAAISSLLSSIKTATDIAQLLKHSHVSLEKAEYKLRLAELVGALADARIELARVQEALAAKDQQIKALEEAADISSKVKYQAPYYWLIEGESRDGPFCQQCYDHDGLLIRLQGSGDGYWNCKTCKNNYTDNNYPV